MRFADHHTERLFIRHVAQECNGVPAALLGMLDSARSEDRMTPANVRGYSHDAGVRYMDLTPILVIVLAARHIGRRIGEVELTVLS